MVYREAVRGIIPWEDKLLLIYSSINGDYKFPGGGVNPGESYTEALTREIREESGAQVTTVEAEFGKVVEYDFPMETDFDVFKMVSMYYICQVSPSFGTQALDDYEQELGFQPVWVDIDTAIRNNEAVLQRDDRLIPRWTSRDTLVLERVREELFGSSSRASISSPE